MTKVFNTEFETSLKILLLLAAVETESITIERIVCYDFISTYGRSFSVYGIDINGENSYRYEEIGARRIRATQAIKSLVLDGLVVVEKSSDGFKYAVHLAGKTIARSLTSEYGKSYAEAVKKTHSKYHAYTDMELITEINKKSVQLIRGV